MTSALKSDDRVAFLPEVFRRVSRETERLAADCDRLQSCIGLLALRSADTALAQDVQAIDGVVQRLFGLSGFLERLSMVAPCADIDLEAALAGVTLSDLASRLAGLPDDHRSSAPRGTLELL